MTYSLQESAAATAEVGVALAILLKGPNHWTEGVTCKIISKKVKLSFRTLPGEAMDSGICSRPVIKDTHMHFHFTSCCVHAID